jgi:outer membrane protein assembly factor BamB
MQSYFCELLWLTTTIATVLPLYFHGITYDNGIIFAGTGKNATLLAVNATDGKQTIPVGYPPKNYVTQGPPTVWKDIVLRTGKF